jgi:nucleotide-binding universal stress UspA family protein
MKTYRKIVVGADLSPPSAIAVQQAMSVARHCGAPLVLMMVEPEPDAPELIPGSLRAVEAKVRDVERTRFVADRAGLEELRQRLLGQGVDVSHVVVSGAVDQGLADGAARANADLVVVGTHGHRGLRRLLLGSVAEMTVRCASSSVLVARGSGTAAEGGFRHILIGTDFSPLSERAIEQALTLAAPGATLEVLHAWRVPIDTTPEGSLALAMADLRTELAVAVEHSLTDSPPSSRRRRATSTSASANRRCCGWAGGCGSWTPRC